MISKQSQKNEFEIMSYQIVLIVYNIYYEAVFIFHFYVINIVPAPRAQGAHPHTPKATQICELDLEFDQGLFTLLICLSVKTVSQVSKQQSVTVVSVKSQVEFYFSNQNIRQCQITSMCSAQTEFKEEIISVKLCCDLPQKRRMCRKKQ